jgi:hypothetical protein
LYLDPPTTLETTVGDRTATATEVTTRELPSGGWRLEFVGAGKPPFDVEGPAGIDVRGACMRTRGDSGRGAWSIDPPVPPSAGDLTRAESLEAAGRSDIECPRYGIGRILYRLWTEL